MYTSILLFLHLLSLRPLLAAVIPAATPNLSAPTLGDAGVVDDEVINANKSDLAYEYTGPLNAQKEPMCNGANFGTQLNLQSCLDALRQLDVGSPLIRSFGQRGTTPTGQVLLPMRSSSGDGRCAIDVVRRADTKTLDYASFAQIQVAASTIMQMCIDGRGINDRGGFVGQVVRKYDPQVACTGPWRGKGDCSPVLDKWSVNTAPQTFGPAGQPGLGAKTPSIWRDVFTSCLARIDMVPARPYDSAAWYDIWAAGEAINAMCVRRGEEGVASHLGKTRALAVTLMDGETSSS
ncbi:MAG: hypothetical protein Q9184_006728 [Pyrenodesmia sp. 2 TL-2023]